MLILFRKETIYLQIHSNITLNNIWIALRLYELARKTKSEDVHKSQLYGWMVIEISFRIVMWMNRL